jgi:RNA polymerase sigma-70 factor (ECF subfamily)
MSGQGQVTELLEALNRGDTSAYDRLVPLIHARLRQLAGSHMRGERVGHTLQPTALVNEAFIQLAGSEARWENRAHFLGAASQAMRRILVDHARARLAEKRAGDRQRVTFADLQVAQPEADVDVLALDEAVTALEAEDPRLAAVVRYRFYVGLSIAEAAALLKTSPATVKRDWSYARAWLLERMSR